MNLVRFWWICLALVLAVFIRLPHLGQRPMHADEAVHAAKLGQYLQTGDYSYDPNDYHGPTLNYLAATIAWIRGQKDLASLDEITVRLVSALGGIALVVAPLAIADGLGGMATVLAMFLTASSPALGYYSRYFLHEPVLVLSSMLLIIAVWRYIKSPTYIWAILLGLAAGLTYATKETCIITFLGLFAGVLAARCKLPRRFHHLLLSVAVAAVLICLVYSGFGTRPSGIVDSLLAFGKYTSRAWTSTHIHPWYYYLKIITWIPLLQRPAWNEDILVLGLLLAVPVIASRRTAKADTALARIFLVYTVTTLVIYSIIPHKTPWCVLGVLHGMIMVTAIAIAELYALIKPVIWQRLLLCGIGVAIASCFTQACVLCFRLHTDPSNPYVYAHTTQDVPELARQIDRISAANPQANQIYIQVMAGQADYWPIPWYLRRYQRVGYWSTIDYTVPAGDIIIAKADLEDDLIQYLYESRQPGSKDLYVWLMAPPIRLRHGVHITALVRQQIHDMATVDPAASIHDH